MDRRSLGAVVGGIGGTAGEHVEHRQRIGDHGDRRAPAQPSGQLGGRGARAECDRDPVVDGRGRQFGDRGLLGALLGGLDRGAGFLAAVVPADRAAVHLAQQFVGIHGVEVAPHRHLGDTQPGSEVGDPHGPAALVEGPQDRPAAFGGKHDRGTPPRTRRVWVLLTWGIEQ